ncbi:MAG: hypothetical protein ACYDET_01680 [Thermoleophilia bacterium]
MPPRERQGLPALDAAQVKLFCDFRQQRLYGGGREIPFKTLMTSGAVSFSPGKGMAVFKGGVNEIPDPGFRGAGWELAGGADIEAGDGPAGRNLLRIQAAGDSAAKAWLKSRIPVAGGSFRTVSFFRKCLEYSAGALVVRATAFDETGQILGTGQASVDGPGGEWRRDGFVWDLPLGTREYSLEITSEGFAGVCLLDAFQAEAKDFFTPYFDGASPACLWAAAATPQHVYASAVTGGPVSRSLDRKKYFYRISSVDAEGRESPASYEASARVGWRHRRIMLTWDRDPEAVKYRIYRGEDSRRETEVIEVEDEAVCWSPDKSEAIKKNVVFELAGNSAMYEDAGFGGVPGQPPAAVAATGSPDGSRSLRPDPDVRLRDAGVGFDLASDFFIAGEVEFGFGNDSPFRPASFFEIGNPLTESMLAVSVRFAPKWGDEQSHILLIKMSKNKEVYGKEPLAAFGAGSVIRFVAGQIFTGGRYPAGAYLWYRIDDGEIRHLTVPDARAIAGEPVLTVSKRFYFDDFANNSYCRTMAFVQETVDEGLAGRLLQPAAGEMMADVFHSVNKR